MRTALASAMPADSSSDVAKAIMAFRAKLDLVGGNADGGRGFGGRGAARTPPVTFVAVHGRLVGQLGTHENGDHAPTESMQQAFTSACRDLTKAASGWKALNATELPALNLLLAKGLHSAVQAVVVVPPPRC